jgi:hypothetical protein
MKRTSHWFWVGRGERCILCGIRYGDEVPNEEERVSSVNLVKDLRFAMKYEAKICTPHPEVEKILQAIEVQRS